VKIPLSVVVAAAVVAAAVGLRQQRTVRLRTERLRAAFISYEGGASKAIEPDVAVNSRGDVAVAWMHVPQPRVRDEGADIDQVGADAIGVRVGEAPHVGTASAVAFRPTLLVRPPGGRFSADPSLAALPSGDFVLTWLGFRLNIEAHGEPYDMGVFSQPIGPNAEATSEPHSVTGERRGRDYDRPSVAVTSRGRLVVAYRFEAPGRAGIEVATSEDGVAWIQHEVSSQVGFLGGLSTVCAARGGTHVYVAYVDPLAGVVLRVSHDDGETFSDPDAHTLSKPGEPVALEAPSCVAEGNEVTVSYGLSASPIGTTSSALLDAVVLVRSRDAGKSFAPWTSVKSEGRRFVHPRLLSLGAGAIGVAAYSLAEGARRADIRLVRAATGASSGEEVLASEVLFAPERSDPNWAGDYLGAAALGAFGMVAYVDPSAGQPEVAVQGFTVR
jgi:hypothetical protein